MHINQTAETPAKTAVNPVATRDTVNRRFSVAPMMDWTDRHCRYFHRQLSRNALLYTEMVTTGALLHGDARRFLRYDEAEHPIALQLGGSDPDALAECSRMAEDHGYDEINLNVGCPSDRVQNNMIGACLMAHPQRVADCLERMQSAVSIPVTVKHRLGIDEMDSYEELQRFIEIVRQSGCRTFIVHARKAILAGLSPKENREVPPLKYEWVYRIKQAFPDLEIIINGGIKSLDQCEQHLQHVDGVMIGREAYQNPYLLAEVDQRLHDPQQPVPTRADVMEKMLDYTARELAAGTYLGHISRHLLGLFHAQRGGRQFRRHLSENAHKPGAGIDVLKAAMERISD
ncbi:tRNA dihydrouridine(20/20a) synthase DusA [Marinobacterium aestuariivivens]|uniref:tRNA-dihydrouridine(20/20a) synthase n=1 Tax=Marinobacterium aestuariivivens TaxID=1698799 RepID=A0ABW1ZVH5_9GAMM